MAHMMSGSLKTEKEPLGGNFAGKEHLGGNFSGQVHWGIQGPPGKTAYEYAKEGGYTGTEEEFAKDLADAASGVLPKVTEADDGKILRVSDGKWVAAELPVYDGIYSVIPAVYEQILETAQTFVDADIRIEKIPYAEVSNNSGGMTATIGGN